MIPTSGATSQSAATNSCSVTGRRWQSASRSIGVVVGELYASTTGIGHMIADAGNTFQPDVVFFGVAIFMSAGLVTVGLLDWIERRFETWRANVR